MLLGFIDCPKFNNYHANPSSPGVASYKKDSAASLLTYQLGAVFAINSQSLFD